MHEPRERDRSDRIESSEFGRKHPFETRMALTKAHKIQELIELCTTGAILFF